MRRTILMSIVFVSLGCVSPDREPLRPLPESKMYDYESLVFRARNQATTALEAFYVDNWVDVEQAAVGLEQTARLLPKTIEIPENLKAAVGPDALLLQTDAGKLAESAKAKNVNGTLDTLQRINLKLRELTPRATRIAPIIEKK